MYKILRLLFKFFTTNSPQKLIKIEIQLMYLFNNKSKYLRKKFSRRIYYKYACEISNMSQIHSSVNFIHPIAVIIGSNVVIEENCQIYQNVTIGSNFCSNNKMPYIKKNTKIGAGAKLIGDIQIGQNCIIGANAVVTKSVPDNSLVFGYNKVKKLNV